MPCAPVRQEVRCHSGWQSWYLQPIAYSESPACSMAPVKQGHESYSESSSKLETHHAQETGTPSQTQSERYRMQNTRRWWFLCNSQNLETHNLYEIKVVSLTEGQTWRTKCENKVAPHDSRMCLSSEKFLTPIFKKQGPFSNLSPGCRLAKLP